MVSASVLSANAPLPRSLPLSLSLSLSLLRSRAPSRVGVCSVVANARPPRGSPPCGLALSPQLLMYGPKKLYKRLCSLRSYRLYSIILALSP